MVDRRLHMSLMVAAVAVAYVGIAVFYTWPLLADPRTRIVSDPYDPILNTSILWWNATVVPFTNAWWTPPFFHPSQDIAAFTENLVGLSPIATPIFWITRDAIVTYNLSIFLTWPLSAFTTYLLVFHLVRRHDAAFIAGLAFGFTPYRMAQIGHVQVLAAYWLPLALLGLHGYLSDGRRRWLALFGIAWVLQSLANGYFMLFGGVVIGLWLLYFCTVRRAWRALPALVLTWLVSTLPLALVMLKYRAVQEHYGLSRGLNVALAFGAEPSAWTRVTDLIWLWGGVLKDAGVEFNLFPGLTALGIVAAAMIGFSFRREATASADRTRRVARATLGALAGLCIIAAVATAWVGPWRVTLWDVTIRMSDIRRAVALAVVCGVPFLLLTPRIWRLLQERRPFVFYVAAAAAAVVFASGPQLRTGTHVLLDPAPYRWLMMFVPGFDALRVPARFWMIGALCLAVAVGVAFAWLVPRRGLRRLAAVALIAAGVLLDSWPRAFLVAAAPGPWPGVEPRDPVRAVVELPLGPAYDAAATFRSLHHRRRVVNGVSGYDPPHYLLLQMGLNARDPDLLRALASLGPLDVVVDASQDADGSLARYVTAMEGVVPLGSDGTRRAYRLPVPAAEPPAGPPIPILGIDAVADPVRARLAIDGNPRTQWQDGPQKPGQWMTVDLGSLLIVGGIEQSTGQDVLGFPRRLAVELSTDGAVWQQVWEGETLARAFLGAVARPRDIVIAVTFQPKPARFVRLSQRGQFDGGWAVAELRVLAPADR